MENMNQPHSELELQEIYKGNNFDNQYFNLFCNYYNIAFEELSIDYADYSESDWIEDGSSLKDISLNLTLYKITKFFKILEKGFSLEWAEKQVEYDQDEENDLFNTYYDVKKFNPELAKNEILRFAKSISEEELFQSYYFKLINNLSFSENRVETAKKYVTHYNLAIENGKSTIYAQKYADLIVTELDEVYSYSKIYCENYAFAYDQALSDGKTEEYALVYAEKLADLFEETKFENVNSVNDEFFDFYMDQVLAYMDAWEYASKNRVVDFDRFVSIYTNLFMNYDYLKNPHLTKEEIKKNILDEALNKVLLINNNDRFRDI